MIKDIKVKRIRKEGMWTVFHLSSSFFQSKNDWKHSFNTQIDLDGIQKLKFDREMQACISDWAILIYVCI